MGFKGSIALIMIPAWGGYTFSQFIMAWAKLSLSVFPILTVFGSSNISDPILSASLVGIMWMVILQSMFEFDSLCLSRLWG